MLIHRTPQIVQHAADADEHLVEMPSVAGLRSSPTQVGTELQAPMPDALVGHHDAAFGQDQLDVTQLRSSVAQGQQELTLAMPRKPHCVTVRRLPRVSPTLPCQRTCAKRLLR